MLWSSGPGQVHGSLITVANLMLAIRLVQWLSWVFETQARKKETCEKSNSGRPREAANQKLWPNVIIRFPIPPGKAFFRWMWTSIWARGKRRGFGPGATARHRSWTRVPWIWSVSGVLFLSGVFSPHSFHFFWDQTSLWHDWCQTTQASPISEDTNYWQSWVVTDKNSNRKGGEKLGRPSK